MIYITKNKIKRLKTFPKNNYGVQLLKDIRLYEKMNPEFKKQRDKMLKSKKNTQERSERSLRRTRKRIQDILNANLDDKSYFITLTFAENLQDYKKANSKFNYFIRSKNQNIKYIVVKEHQKRGAIHFHLIVFDINEKDLKSLINSWSYGFTHHKKINDFYTYSMANYLTNYMTDKNQLVEANKKVFSKSTNLKRPLIISNDIINQIIEKYNFDVDLERYDWLQHDYIIESKATHDLAIKIIN